MSDAEKVAAFDAIADALTNQWHDGRWSWISLAPCGGEHRATREEAVAALKAKAMYQEDATAELHRVLAAEVETVGWHSGVRTRCVVGGRA